MRVFYHCDAKLLSKAMWYRKLKRIEKAGAMQGKNSRLRFRHSEFKILPKLPGRRPIRYDNESLPHRVQWTAESAGEEREANGLM